MKPLEGTTKMKDTAIVASSQPRVSHSRRLINLCRRQQHTKHENTISHTTKRRHAGL